MLLLIIGAVMTLTLKTVKAMNQFLASVLPYRQSTPTFVVKWLVAVKMKTNP